MCFNDLRASSRKADDGMHVLAGGLYGLLREDRWVDTGGSIERWLADAVARGRFRPDRLVTCCLARSPVWYLRRSALCVR